MKCELCKSAARTYCESDQANLCWNCDAKVHGANFLVARHARALLCQSCQSLTPWKASGAQLGHAVSDDLNRSSSLRMYGNTATSVEFYKFFFHEGIFERKEKGTGPDCLSRCREIWRLCHFMIGQC
ncbi:hypothetical protein SADUNF_Sadunf13G0116200 [Salix dunnii]|uniref:B box-type domain-containing protein n=1 Tax=Salix dunnii TaxID=1413687 RepID=A0A835JKE4_9ROSI|nr:hypothetical protein SADUNF_Sadunf13G0116200 [Salix dunnii]